jgi:hypothetical protein
MPSPVVVGRSVLAKTKRQWWQRSLVWIYMAARAAPCFSQKCVSGYEWKRVFHPNGPLFPRVYYTHLMARTACLALLRLGLKKKGSVCRCHLQLLQCRFPLGPACQEGIFGKREQILSTAPTYLITLFVSSKDFLGHQSTHTVVCCLMLENDNVFISCCSDGRLVPRVNPSAAAASHWSRGRSSSSSVVVAIGPRQRRRRRLGLLLPPQQQLCYVAHHIALQFLQMVVRCEEELWYSVLVT